MRYVAIALAVLGLASIACSPRPEPAATTTGQTAAAPAPDCPPVGNLNFICGLKAPEDLLLLPSTRWLMVSGMEAGSGLHLIDTQAKAAQTVPVVSQPNLTRYPNCPGPLDMTNAVLHGLSSRAGQAGHLTMYATNHGGRESIEVFDVDPQAPVPSVAWIGCVVLPAGLAANSVAAFNDGAIVATVLTTPGKTFEDIFSGRDTGVVLMWTPGSAGFQPLPGTELSGNNGIETSPDDREFYVAASGSKRIVAFARANPARPLRTAQLTEFAPDNVRFAGGLLVTAGMIDDEPSCGGAPRKPEDIRCPRGYIAVSVDPQTMAVRELARGPAAAPYSGTATAVQVGSELWLSSFSADRVAYRTLP